MASKEKVWIFDSTLRDGAQARGITFSTQDRINMMHLLDDFGIDYIEAGNPSSNPKERVFFEQVKASDLKHSRLVAFGPTRRKNTVAAEDPGMAELLAANAPVVTIFGKSWDLHVTEVLGATLEQNLDMIYDSVQYIKSQGLGVIYDAEHFFDGYKHNPDYAMKTLKAAADAGAECLVLCETNGGAMPTAVFEATKRVVETYPQTQVGIHCHNDSELAVANSLMAIEAGARHVQGTFIGFGERCGNANLTALIANLQLKMGFDCVPEEKMKELYARAHEAAEIANIALDEKMPYVGADAFAHKAGMHIDGVNKVSHSFEHVSPASVGNQRTFLISEVAGQTALVAKLADRFPALQKGAPETKALIEKLKTMEAKGYHFEGAESSFELLVKRYLGELKSYFKVDHFKIIDEPAHGDHDGVQAYAMVKVDVNGETFITAAEGNGPVNALDKALRSALMKFFPQLKSLHLTDYRVRVLDSYHETDAMVRVMIEWSDKAASWTTLGVSSDVIEASLQAMCDAIEYKLLKDEQ